MILSIGVITTIYTLFNVPAVLQIPVPLAEKTEAPVSYTHLAWNFMEKEELDLALLDIMMPKISGLELCKKIRERYNYPIIMPVSYTHLCNILGNSCV